MKPANEKAVLFIDLLGFASLVSEYPVDVDDLVGQDRLSGMFAACGSRIFMPLDLIASSLGAGEHC